LNAVPGTTDHRTLHALVEGGGSSVASAGPQRGRPPKRGESISGPLRLHIEAG
jgi:hypothetical protein